MSFTGGTFIGRCQPLYSAVEPITIGSVITYRYYRYLWEELRTEPVELLVPGQTFTFRMDERPTGQPPVITSFSVKSIAMVNTRCALGELCELVDGDRIHNGQDGDYGRDLVLNVTASDPENNPLTVEWFCRQGDYFEPITDQSGGAARCFLSYYPILPIYIYAHVSDGDNVVSTPMRQVYMSPIVH